MSEIEAKVGHRRHLMHIVLVDDNVEVLATRARGMSERTEAVGGDGDDPVTLRCFIIVEVEMSDDEHLTLARNEVVEVFRMHVASPVKEVVPLLTEVGALHLRRTATDEEIGPRSRLASIHQSDFESAANVCEQHRPLLLRQHR